MIGIVNKKTTSVRIVPVPIKPDANRWVYLMGEAGLLGTSPIMDLKFTEQTVPLKFLKRGGRIPRPITSFGN